MSGSLTRMSHRGNGVGGRVVAVNQISAVIDRLQADPAFRTQYSVDPDSVLSSYRLSGNEARALKTGDGHELELMGLGDKWDVFVQAVCGPHVGD